MEEEDNHRVCLICYETVASVPPRHTQNDDPSGESNDDDDDDDPEQPSSALDPYEKEDNANDWMRVSEDCQHAYCRSCLMEYSRHCLARHQVPIPCPHISVPSPGGAKQHQHQNENDNVKDEDPADGACTAFLYETVVRNLLMPTTSSSSWNSRIEEEGGNDDAAAEEKTESDDNTNNNNNSNNNNINPDDWNKYQRLYRMSQDASLIPCPRCNALCEVPPNSSSRCSSSSSSSPSAATVGRGRGKASSRHKHNQRTCTACRHVFCAVHGDAHPQHHHHYNDNHHHHDDDLDGSTYCRAYEQSLASAKKRAHKSEKALRKSLQKQQSSGGGGGGGRHAADTIKPCSRCGAFLQKAAGCDHVVCPACHNDMCYKCGTHNHLTGKVYRSCAHCRQSYLDHRYDCQHRLRLCVLLPFVMPLAVVYTALMTLVAVLSCCFFGCFACGACVVRDHHDNDEAATTRRRRKQPGGGSASDSSLSLSASALAPVRGVALVGLILFLPIILLWHDFGLPVSASFSHWLEDLPAQTQQQQQDHNRNDDSDDDNESNRNSNDVHQQPDILAEIPTVTLEEEDDDDDEDLAEKGRL